MIPTVPATYPLLEAILRIKDIPLLPMYSTRDIAKIFDVTSRAIQSRIQAKQLRRRDLPGRAKFLPQDLEDFLKKSAS